MESLIPPKQSRKIWLKKKVKKKNEMKNNLLLLLLPLLLLGNMSLLKQVGCSIESKPTCRLAWNICVFAITFGCHEEKRTDDQYISKLKS